MAALVTWAASLPIRATRKGAGVVLFLVGIRRRRRYAISVAGLDESKAQPLYFALRRAATHHDEQDTADRWLEALHLCQCASILLMSELDVVEGNLLFWHRQEQRGRHSHFWQSMLQRGPLQFMGRLAVILHISRRQHGALGEADLVEKRVLIFRLLRSALCEALAQVQSAAGLLYLKGHVAASAGALPPDEENLFHRADRMVTASLSAVASAFAQLERSVHNTLDGQQGPAAPPAQDWQVLQGALSRVLGMHHLRNVLSRLQLAQEQQPALEGGPELAATTDAEAADAAGEITAVEAVAADTAPDGAASSASTAVAALDRARRAVGVTAALPANVTVHSMLEHAHRTARSMGRARRLIEVPRWALMPSDLQRHWVRYAAITLAAGYSSLFIYRHSQLSGSRDLEVWAASLVSSVRGAWRSHVVGPLAGVKDELFNTFRRRPTVISTDDFEAERGSLQRMLVEFQHDFARKRGSSNASSAAADTADSYGLAANGGTAAAAAAAHQAAELQRLQEGMDLVMRTYERELKKPLRNLVGGELVRALLIQVQKLKVDTASAMVEMDQILKANELSIQLVAAVPAFLIAGGSLYWLGRLVTPTPPDPRREALPVRMSMIEVERALEHVAAAEEAAEAAGPDAVEGDAEAREQQGQFAYRLAVAYEEAQELFRRHRGLIAIGGSEWPNIRSDMLSLASPGPVAQHMRTVQRMMRSYSIFQQF